MRRNRIWAVALFLAGACAGAATSALMTMVENPAIAQDAAAQPSAQALAAEIAAIKGKLPSQSHTMQDVSYHFCNLWFAGQQENWGLANFYWAETLSHLHWAVRVIPVRKDNAGKDVDLRPILEGFENGPLKQLQAAIVARDREAFEKHYRTSLDSCYGCHKSSDKPYLRLQIPQHPESAIVNFDPHAD